MAQENARPQSGLLEEEIDLLNEECCEKLDEVEHDLMDVVEGRAEETPDFLKSNLSRLPQRKGSGRFPGK